MFCIIYNAYKQLYALIEYLVFFPASFNEIYLHRYLSPIQWNAWNFIQVFVIALQNRYSFNDTTLFDMCQCQLIIDKDIFFCSGDVRPPVWRGGPIIESTILNWWILTLLWAHLKSIARDVFQLALLPKIEIQNFSGSLWNFHSENFCPVQ